MEKHSNVMDTGGLCNLFDPSLSQRLGAVGNVLADMSIEQIRVLTDHSNVISLTQTQLIDTKPFGLMITDPEVGSWSRWRTAMMSHTQIQPQTSRETFLRTGTSGRSEYYLPGRAALLIPMVGVFGMGFSKGCFESYSNTMARIEYILMMALYD